MQNPLLAVRQLGQSIWYDNIQRSLITSGDLRAMVEDDGLCGVTSNPAIFEKALNGSADYEQPLRALVEAGAPSALDIYERLAMQDIQMAADVLAPVYRDTDGVDGYVSLEVSPYLAHDTQATLDEARRLFAEVARPNVMIKVPATPAGIPAIATLIGEGINVNVTLLFAVAAYEAVADAYLNGLEALDRTGGDLRRVASVASFFVSRIDTLIDGRLDRARDAETDEELCAALERLRGTVAIANAKVAYAVYRALTDSPRWQALAAKGARPQRLLWASTSTKNPDYSPTLYVDELIGPDTVNTVPGETFEAFRSQGRATPALTDDWDANLAAARATIQSLEDVGISLDRATAQLLDEGVRKFADPFDALLSSIERKRQALLGSRLAGWSCNFDKADLDGVTEPVNAVLHDWRTHGKLRRLWNRDATLWTGADEDRWLGWLDCVARQRAQVERLETFAQEIRRDGFRHVLLLGMGGSSLAPEVMRTTFGVIPDFPELHVLDSTVPAQVEAVSHAIDLRRTLFIVASKSGGTLEPNVLADYFTDQVSRAVGADDAGRRFVAITDPDSPLQHRAERDGFRAVFLGEPSIGGRYSALSNFGLVPAAVTGIDVRSVLDRAALMVQSCTTGVPPEVNPGVRLGLVIGSLTKAGRDKLTLACSPSLRALGAWIEQLIAESTGKCGLGVVPIDAEVLGPPEVYGNDRLFVSVRLEGETGHDAALAALDAAGQPVVRITLADRLDIGQEFFRWEMATAVAGAALGINPFDQPDVEASKAATRKLTETYEKTGAMSDEAPLLIDGPLRLFAAPDDRAVYTSSAAACLAMHLNRLQAGDYFSINAYIERNAANERELQAIRHAVRDAKRVATMLGFGPRLLHSTGQLHKGGPNAGVFLHVTADDARDVPVPGRGYGFGTLKHFQAQGDFEVLAARGRRVLRVHLGADVAAGLRTLRETVTRGLA